MCVCVCSALTHLFLWGVVCVYVWMVTSEKKDFVKDPSRIELQDNSSSDRGSLHLEFHVSLVVVIGAYLHVSLPPNDASFSSTRRCPPPLFFPFFFTPVTRSWKTRLSSSPVLTPNREIWYVNMHLLLFAQVTSNKKKMGKATETMVAPPLSWLIRRPQPFNLIGLAFTLIKFPKVKRQLLRDNQHLMWSETQ